MPRLALVLTLVAFGPVGTPSIRDLDGGTRRPFAPPDRAALLVFVTSDCPISNGYAPVIQDLCRTYGRRGVDCLLLYEDARITASAARAHRAAYGLAAVPAAVDDERTIAGAAGVTVTPETAVLDRSGTIRYRGRIDDLYVDLGRRRAAVTAHDLRDALDAVLAGRTVVQPRTPALGCYIAPPWKGAKESS
jgi:hypothetical protein